MKTRKLLLAVLKNLKFLPVKKLLEIRYEYYCDEKIDWDNPTKFNEKIQWLKLFYHVPLLTQLADKYEVRSYVEAKIGEQYLNELYDVVDKVEDLKFDKYPNQFVLKGAHGSSLNLLVTDKKTLDITKTKKQVEKWLQHNQYTKVGYEWAYKNIKPKIVVEKFLKEEGRDVLLDYKFFCFNGKPKFVQIDIDRGFNHCRCYFDLNWNKLPFTFAKRGNYISKNNLPKNFYKGGLDKPDNFEEMINLAEKLADKFPFARVDFYSVEGKTIFGEITFYPEDGKARIVPYKYNKILGDFIKLPSIPKGKNVITTIDENGN